MSLLWHFNYDRIRNVNRNTMSFIDGGRYIHLETGKKLNIDQVDFSM